MNRYSIVTLWLVSFFVCGVGFASVYGQADQSIVQLEQRRPNTLPPLSASGWLSGRYAKAFEAWLSDRVVWRQSALDAQEWLRSVRGFSKSRERIVTVAQDNPYAMEPESSEELLLPDEPSPHGEDVQSSKEPDIALAPSSRYLCPSLRFLSLSLIPRRLRFVRE